MFGAGLGNLGGYFGDCVGGNWGNMFGVVRGIFWGYSGGCVGERFGECVCNYSGQF